MKRITLALLAVITIFVAGCSVGPKYTKPSVPMTPMPSELGPDAFKATQGWKSAQPADATLRGDWWTLFSDPELNALEAQIDVSNQNVKAVEARFTQERAAIKIVAAW